MGLGTGQRRASPVLEMGACAADPRHLRRRGSAIEGPVDSRAGHRSSLGLVVAGAVVFLAGEGHDRPADSEIRSWAADRAEAHAAASSTRHGARVPSVSVAPPTLEQLFDVRDPPKTPAPQARPPQALPRTEPRTPSSSRRTCPNDAEPAQPREPPYAAISSAVQGARVLRVTVAPPTPPDLQERKEKGPAGFSRRGLCLPVVCPLKSALYPTLACVLLCSGGSTMDRVFRTGYEVAKWKSTPPAIKKLHRKCPSAWEDGHAAGASEVRAFLPRSCRVRWRSNTSPPQWPANWAPRRNIGAVVEESGAAPRSGALDERLRWWRDMADEMRGRGTRPADRARGGVRRDPGSTRLADPRQKHRAHPRVRLVPEPRRSRRQGARLAHGLASLRPCWGPLRGRTPSQRRGLPMRA